MTLDRNALDRHITGNYGADQFPDEAPDCRCLHRVHLGDEPADYDYPDGSTVPVYQCVGCGDLFDTPGATCAHPMRDGRCTMDPGHRGRHTTVSFVCDGCDKARRGQPAAYALNQWDGVAEASFCFMCVRRLT